MSDGPAASRRAFLAGTATVAGGTSGCLGGLAAGSWGRRDRPVSLLAAGSLHNALENGLRRSVDVPLAVEAHGSAAAARFVADGQKDPDVVSLADVALFDAPLSQPWYAEFATNSLVLVYDHDSTGGRRVAAAGRDRWYEPLLDGDVAFGRTDPDLDPLGYRTLFALELATDHYGTDVDLRAAIPATDQVYPETELLAAFETGTVDAAVVYRSMAVDRGFEFVDLPAAVDLSDPARADRYASTSYELPDGTVVDGAVVSYASAARRRTTAIESVFERHLTGAYLTEFGFAVPDDYPRYTGDVPAAFAV